MKKLLIAMIAGCMMSTISFAMGQTYHDKKVSQKRQLCEANSRSWCAKHTHSCNTPPKIYCLEKYRS